MQQTAVDTAGQKLQQAANLLACFEEIEGFLEELKDHWEAIDGPVADNWICGYVDGIPGNADILWSDALEEIQKGEGQGTHPQAVSVLDRYRNLYRIMQKLKASSGEEQRNG